MENLWETIAKARGVAINEDFSYSLDGVEYKYRINEKGLEMYEDGQWYSSSRANAFIRGEGKIEREPFRPQRAEVYYTIIHNTATVSYHWGDTTADYERLIAGLVFRTKEEAEAYIPTWKERISNL